MYIYKRVLLLNSYFIRYYDVTKTRCWYLELECKACVPPLTNGDVSS